MRLFDIRRYFTKHNKQVVILYASTILGTILGLVSSIINTHFISPADYGDTRYVQNIVAFIASFLLFGFFLSGSRLLALSKEEGRSRSIRGVMVLILLAASIILAIGTFICGLIHIGEPNLSSLFFLAIPVCFYPLLNSYIANTAQGDNHIGRLAITNCLPYLLYNVIAFIVYKCFGGTSARMLLLQWGIFTAVLICVIISTKPTFKNVRQIFAELNKENKHYGMQLYFGSLFMIGSNYLAGITLGIFNTDNINVGFYTLALSVTSPLAMLPGVIGITYYKDFATQSRIPLKVLFGTLLLATITGILFVFFIKPIVLLFYTSSYGMVGVYASWMAIGFCIHGIGDMLNRYLGSHGQGKQIRNASIICGVIKLIGFTLFVYFWNINGAVIANIMGSTAYCLTLVYYYFKYIKDNAPTI